MLSRHHATFAFPKPHKADTSVDFTAASCQCRLHRRTRERWRPSRMHCPRRLTSGTRDRTMESDSELVSGQGLWRCLGLAEALTYRTALALAVISESWDDDFVFRPTESSSSSRSSGSSLPGDFSPTSTSTTSRRLSAAPTDRGPLNGHETQLPLSATRTARHRESKWSLASADWTAWPDPDATITPSGRSTSRSTTHVHVAPSSSKTRRLQPCSSPKFASSPPFTAQSHPCPASADAEVWRSSSPTPAEDISSSLTTREDDLATESDGEVAVAASEVESRSRSRSRPAPPLRSFGTRCKATRRVVWSHSGEGDARPASVKAISAVETPGRNSSQVSFAPTESDSAVHASRIDFTQFVGPGAALSPPSSSYSRKRKLVKKRPPEQQQTVTASLSALALSTDGTSERPLLAPSSFSTSSGDSARPVLGRAPSERPSADPTRSDRPLAVPTRPSLHPQKPRTPRTRSVTTPARSSGATIVIEKDWIGVESFPPPVRASPFAAPDRRPSLRLLRDRSASRSQRRRPAPDFA